MSALTKADYGRIQARELFEQEHPGVWELFGDLLEITLWATQYERGAKVTRTDTNETLAEYDLQ
jgi:hypothetical protein